MTNPRGSDIEIKTNYINVSPPLPVASFTADQKFGSAPFTVQFNDTSLNNPISWDWDFGDSGTSDLQNPGHTYALSGTYNVSLNATNTEGSNSITKIGYIKVDPVPSTVPIKIIPSGATVYIGESALNLTRCMGTSKTLAWFQSGTSETSTTPDQMIDLTGQEHAFSITPATFSENLGTWYSWHTGNNLGNATPAFRVVDPEIDLVVWDATMGTDADGRMIPVGNDIEFRIETNLANMTERGIQGAPIEVIVTGPRGVTHTTLTAKSGNVTSMDLAVPSPQYSTGPIWDTENSLYQTGKYTISAGSSANQMLVYYPVIGRTLTQNRTINLSFTAVPGQYPPTFTAITPASAYRNNTATFSITGTNFQPNGTVMEFRNQTNGTITTTLNSVTATRINGTIAIPANAVTGLWNIRIITTDGGENTKLNAFTVAAVPAPVITSIAPVSGFQNSTVNFTIVGTGFEPGLTDVKILNITAPGTELPVTVLNVTTVQMTGSVWIPGDAIAGNFYRLNITTADGGLVSKPTAFTVNKVLLPTITSITPASGLQNNTVNFTIVGTNFQPGLTNVKILNITAPGTELPVSILNVTTVQITGSVWIPDDAIAGNFYRLNVSTINGGLVSKPTAFTVGIVPVPTITSITPATGIRNSTVNFTIIGTNFQPGLTDVKISTIVMTPPPTDGVGRSFSMPMPITETGFPVIIINVTTVQVKGQVVIPETAILGNYNLDVITRDGGLVRKTAAFNVTAWPVPTISTFTPASAPKNSTVSFVLTGTNFRPGYTNVSLSNIWNGIPFYLNLASVTSTRIDGTFTIPGGELAGTHELRVTTTDGGTAIKDDAFTLNSLPLPTITSITPTSGSKNSTTFFTIVGTNFETNNGTVVTFRNSYSSIQLNTTITSVTPTQITGNLVIPADAPMGAWTLGVTTFDGGEADKADAFTVNYMPVPTITSITPISAYKNGPISFTIAGTNFEPDGKTYVRLRTTTGAPVYAVLSNVASTTITGNFTIPNDAVSGLYIVDVVTVDGGGNSKLNAFTVNPFPAPTITSITPASAYRNTTANFIIVGTNFQPGLTDVKLLNITAPGTELPVTVLNVTKTQIIGYVGIPIEAIPGNFYRLNITTGDGGLVSKPTAFTVIKQPLPTITSITPATGFRNSTVSYTIVGTNFQPGLTIVNLSIPAYGELDTTVYAVTTTQIIGGVRIPSNAPVGAWKLNVTTVDGGTATKVSAFTISKVPLPVITTFTPVSGYRGTTISFVIDGSYYQSGGRTDCGAHPARSE